MSPPTEAASGCYPLPLQVEHFPVPPQPGHVRSDWVALVAGRIPTPPQLEHLPVPEQAEHFE
jgi:hypothetical protein